MLSIIKPRGDIKSNWDSANPVLRMREWGVEWDTTVGVGDVKIKIGDGVTPWSTLDYVIVSDVTKKIVKTFAEVTAENPELTENSAMDVLWATAKKKFEYLNTKVTDISENGDIDLTKVNIPTFTEYTESTLPDARTAITNITAGIKMPAFISNAKAALKGLVTLGEMRSLLVNSGLTTETGKYFLDAAYGKTLADQISQLNSTLRGRIGLSYNPTNWDTLGLNSQGIIISAIGFEKPNVIIGFPDGAYAYGCLLTFNSLNSNTDEFRNVQVYIPHNSSTSGNINPIYVRTFKDYKDASFSPVWRVVTPSGLVDAGVQS